MCYNSDVVDTEESIVHSYTKSFNALAAKLSEDEAQRISGTTLGHFQYSKYRIRQVNLIRRVGPSNFDFLSITFLIWETCVSINFDLGITVKRM